MCNYQKKIKNQLHIKIKPCSASIPKTPVFSHGKCVFGFYILGSIYGFYDSFVLDIN